jgi:hypothetical protein
VDRILAPLESVCFSDEMLNLVNRLRDGQKRGNINEKCVRQVGNILAEIWKLKEPTIVNAFATKGCINSIELSREEMMMKPTKTKKTKKKKKKKNRATRLPTSSRFFERWNE